jgi:hypothetical protein
MKMSREKLGLLPLVQLTIMAEEEVLLRIMPIRKEWKLNFNYNMQDDLTIVVRVTAFGEGNRAEASAETRINTQGYRKTDFIMWLDNYFNEGVDKEVLLANVRGSFTREE